jgi:hypothetical protein
MNKQINVDFTFITGEKVLPGEVVKQINKWLQQIAAIAA